VRFLKSFTNLVGVGLSVLLLIWFVEIMNHKNRATESFSSSETFSNKYVKVSILLYRVLDRMQGPQWYNLGRWLIQLLPFGGTETPYFESSLASLIKDPRLAVF